MRIVIIGTGNVSTVLGRRFKRAGHNIIQIFGRNETRAQALSFELDAEPANDLRSLHEADLYLIAVVDKVIPKIARELRVQNGVVAHTGASVAKQVLKGASTHYGVFYPLQTLQTVMPEPARIPIFIDANDAFAMVRLRELAGSISPNDVAVADDEKRLKLHVAAVVVNNFPNYLYQLAERYCEEEGIEFRLLLPLIEQTAKQLHTASPSQAQTGPAVREDEETIHRHLELLEKHPRLKKVYEVLTDSIKKGNA